MGALVREQLSMPGTGDKLLGARMKTRRLALGLELEEVGAALTPRVVGRTVRAYEDGANEPRTVEALRQIARVLQTTVAYLVGETDNPVRPADRLRRAGIDPGNFEQMSDETFASALVGMVEEFTARSVKRALQPPAGGQQGGLDADGRDGEAAHAG